MRRLLMVAVLICFGALGSAWGGEKLNVLIVDGQNNHGWMRTTPILKWILEESGRFNVEVSTSPGSMPRGPQAPKAGATDEQKKAHEEAVKKFEAERAALAKTLEEKWAAWKPDFKKYHVVVSNYNGQPWPNDVKTAFLEYVRNGGGFVSVHAANNAFAEWPEYNEMIGLGGWGGRNEKFGPYIRYREGKVVRDETAGGGGKHGRMHEFMVETREAEHPILKGLPLKWKHTSDELYSHLRGPAKNLTVLATAYSAPETGGSNEHEPMLMTIQFEKGRVFHTTLGHAEVSMHGVGFQATFARGTEWAATGVVTLPVPQGLSEAEAAQKLPPGK